MFVFRSKVFLDFNMVSFYKEWVIMIYFKNYIFSRFVLISIISVWEINNMVMILEIVFKRKVRLESEFLSEFLLF